VRRSTRTTARATPHAAMNTKLKIVAFLTPLLIALDQLTKYWTVSTLRYDGPRLGQSTRAALDSWGQAGATQDEIQLIPGFLSFVHRQNPGAAMGMLVDYEHRMYVFLAFTIVAIGVLWSMYKALPDEDRFQSTTVALIFAGAVGNAIDRVHKQTVTDFIKMYTEWPPLSDWLISTFRTNEYPTYNIADSCIVVGVIMYLGYYLFFERDGDVKPGEAGPSPLDAEDPPTPRV
jgi:signal peptidase II